MPDYAIKRIPKVQLFPRHHKNGKTSRYTNVYHVLYYRPVHDEILADKTPATRLAVQSILGGVITVGNSSLAAQATGVTGYTMAQEPTLGY